jgi:hypothetical protein
MLWRKLELWFQNKILDQLIKQNNVSDFKSTRNGFVSSTSKFRVDLQNINDYGCIIKHLPK